MVLRCFTWQKIWRMLDLQLSPLCSLRAAKRFPELGGWTAITISRREMTALFGLGWMSRSEHLQRLILLRWLGAPWRGNTFTLISWYVMSTRATCDTPWCLDVVVQRVHIGRPFRVEDSRLVEAYPTSKRDWITFAWLNGFERLQGAVSWSVERWNDAKKWFYIPPALKPEATAGVGTSA